MQRTCDGQPSCFFLPRSAGSDDAKGKLCIAELPCLAFDSTDVPVRPQWRRESVVIEQPCGPTGRYSSSEAPTLQCYHRQTASVSGASGEPGLQCTAYQSWLASGPGGAEQLEAPSPSPSRSESPRDRDAGAGLQQTRTHTGMVRSPTNELEPVDAIMPPHPTVASLHCQCTGSLSIVAHTGSPAAP